MSRGKKVEACPYRCHLSIGDTIIDDAQAVEPEPTAQPNRDLQDNDEEDQGRDVDID